MDLQISVFLLFILFTGGHSLSCYACLSVTGSCADQTVQTCSSGFSKCMSYTVVSTTGGNTTEQKIKGCVPSDSCLYNIKTSGISVFCCNTDLCNAKDAELSGDSSSNVINVPDFPNVPNILNISNVPNGNKCYYCDGQRCSYIDCLGIEDHCFTATVTSKGQSVKGCIPKAYCDAASVGNIESISCCEGNLCNGAQSVTQSFLFLCCSLLSYFLLH